MGNQQCCQADLTAEKKNEDTKVKNFVITLEDKEQEKAAELIQQKWRQKKTSKVPHLNIPTQSKQTAKAVPEPIPQPKIEGDFELLNKFPGFNLKLKEIIKENKDLTEVNWKEKGVMVPNTHSSTETKALKLKTGEIYKGEIKNGLRSGFGENLWPNQSSYYIGQWLEGQSNGFGILVGTDMEEVYQGEWKSGMAEGNGIHRTKLGFTYNGSWKDDQKHGKGVEEGDGYRYEGDYLSGQIHGYGKLKMQGKLDYEGNFSRGKFNGKGSCVWSHGGTYEGDWENGEMHGQGKFKWEDGSYYVGGYQNNKKHGKGEFVWEDSKRLVGTWVDGEKDGKFEFYNENNIKRLAEYKNGKRIKV